MRSLISLLLLEGFWTKGHFYNDARSSNLDETTLFITSLNSAIVSDVNSIQKKYNRAWHTTGGERALCLVLLLLRQDTKWSRHLGPVIPATQYWFHLQRSRRFITHACLNTSVRVVSICLVPLSGIIPSSTVIWSIPSFAATLSFSVKKYRVSYCRIVFE